MLARKKRHLRLKRAIAIFLLITIVNQVLAPTVAYALTAGPTAPEATNFEPIDTTDMVNPLTGSFTYGMPLLEVPGPEGSYPLALSYHAGIQPNEEASWVGLGWSLNPGAIARNVNGYPDDWKASDGAGGTTFNYWQGRTQTTYSVGLGYGIPNTPFSVNADLTFSQDTYKGFGLGVEVGAGYNFGPGNNDKKQGPFNLGVHVGISPYGDTYAGVGVSEREDVPGLKGLKMTGSIGLNTNFKTVTVSEGVGFSAGGFSLLGASINSSAMKPSFSVGGGSFTHANNSEEGKVNDISSSFSLSIPIGFGFNLDLGYSYRRYWSATNDKFNANGVFYNRSKIIKTTDINYNSSTDDWIKTDDDNYSILDPINSNLINDPLTVSGGTFPNFDDYSVTAQGLGGSMRPYIFSSLLFNQSRVNNNDNKNDAHSLYFSSNTTPSTIGNKWQFRFINDLSNSYTQKPNWNSDQGFGFDPTPKYGKNDGDYGYDQATNRLEGTNHIEYFTNAQITDGTATGRGFITVPDEAGFNRASCPSSQIGGFMITNSSGVTYHYALPAYSSHEIFHTETIGSDPSKLVTSDLNKNTQYAYTWYLTAITGPDYISRGSTKGLIDKIDWGYWVKFDYGKWTNKYCWSTPSTGLAPDIDAINQTFSSGIKEVYYLDAIETRTHTAVFEKELRADAKGNSTFYYNNSYPRESFQPISTQNVSWNDLCGQASDVINYPAASLRLKEILLFQNNQLPLSIAALRSSTTNYQQSFTFNPCSTGSASFQNQEVHLGQNVIDSFDIAANPNMITNCLRRIVFNHDYSLCPGTPNSYDPTGTNTYISPQAKNPNQVYAVSPLMGKLTLLSVDFQGKGGTSMTPSVQFQYDLDPTSPANRGGITITSAPTNQVNTVQDPNYSAYNGTSLLNTHLSQSAGVNQIGSIMVKTSGVFNPGDIISFPIGAGRTSVVYYCTILSPNGSPNGFNVLFLNNSPGTGSNGVSTIATKTKNPPYNYDANDIWRYYKSDYVADPNNITFSKTTSSVSNSSTDVWSLRRVVSSLGATVNINYEGNTYKKSILNSRQTLALKSGTEDSDFDVSGKIHLNPNLALNLDISITNLFDMKKPLKGYILFYRINRNPTQSGQNPTDFQAVNLDSYPKTQILSIGTNDVYVQLDPDLLSFLKSSPMASNSGSIQFIHFVCGNIIPNSSVNIYYGGGIRVKSIITDDLNNGVKQTLYNYNDLGVSPNDINSSGVTSYNPGILDPCNVEKGINDIVDDINKNNKAIIISQNDQNNAIKTYKGLLYKGASYLTAISRNVPNPGIMYETVSVNNYSILPNGNSIPIEGTTVYQYEVFKPEMLGLYENYYESPISYNSTAITPSGRQLSVIKKSARDISIKDYTSRLGNLKRVISYDKDGNKLTEKINHYLYDDLVNTSFQNQINNYEPRLATFDGTSNYNGVSYNNMGVIKERYGTARTYVDPSIPGVKVKGYERDSNGNIIIVNFYAYKYDETLVMSNVETFPSFQTGTTQIDYKNGTRMDQSNLAYDFYTGAVTQTLTTDSYGNRFISVATPAYTKYPALGLKTFDDDPSNPNYTGQHKQMLSQQASNYTFSVDANNVKIGVITATAQTWSSSVPVLDPTGNEINSPTDATKKDGSQSNIWRMEKSYKWMPTGTSANNVQPYGSFVDFFSTGNQTNMNASWKKTSQITQYNVYSTALEASDINNNYAATRMGYNNTKILFTGGIARYNEIAYAGAEDAMLTNGNFSNQISPGGGTVVTDSTLAHTGVNSLMVPAGSDGFNYTVALASLNPTPQNYSIAVWVKPAAGGSVNQAYLYYQIGSNPRVTPPQTYTKIVAGSYLLEMTVPATALTGGNLVVGCNNGSQNTLYFDDFRFQPTAASATAYVYDSRTGELTYILGNSNLYTRFQYDAIGRLVRTYNEVLGKPNSIITKTIRYNYAKITYKNVAESQTFYNKNCDPSNSIAQPYIYTVPAGKYTSTNSITEANNLALAEIAQQGQSTANTSGVCSPAVNFTVSNSTGVGFYVSFSGGSGSNSPILCSGNSTSFQIPPGTYRIDIYNSSSTYNTNYHFQLWDGTTFPVAPIAYFTNVNLAPGSSTNYSLSIY